MDRSRKKLGIPDKVVWGGQARQVWNALTGDFMKDVIDGVDVLLAEHPEIKIAVFSGQLDLICDTPGNVRWVEKLQWSGLDAWQDSHREVIAVNDDLSSAFYKKHDNFIFYWMMLAGHMIPLDHPHAGIWMLHHICDIIE